MIIHALKQILTRPWFWVTAKLGPKPPERDELEVAENVTSGRTGSEDEGCAILTTAERLVKVVGKPGLEVYLDAVKIHETWAHSNIDIAYEIFLAGYVWPNERIWRDLARQIPGFPGRFRG